MIANHPFVIDSWYERLFPSQYITASNINRVFEISFVEEKNVELVKRL